MIQIRANVSLNFYSRPRIGGAHTGAARRRQKPACDSRERGIGSQSSTALGRKLRANSAFPKGANVNFCRVIGENEVEELTYERGVEDFTLACGTGTGSVVAALMRRGLVSGENTKVHVPGGELFITLNTDPQTQEITDIYLTGPTNIVAEGEVCDEELHVLL